MLIPYNIEYKKYDFELLIKNRYPNTKFIFHCLEGDTNGPVETINIMLNNINIDINDEPILCLDSDNFYTCDIVNLWNGDNCVMTFNDTQPNQIYSYAKCNDDILVDIKEKNKISDLACTGAYGFEKTSEFKKFVSKILSEQKTQHGEFYTSGVIKEMIINNIIIKNKIVNKSDYICVDTPTQLLMYCNEHLKSSINEKQILERNQLKYVLILIMYYLDLILIKNIFW